MRTLTGTSLVIAAVLALAPARQLESQGISGLIKKKAVEAAKGKDAKKDAGKEIAKDDGPMTSQFEKECGPVTPETVENFLKGIQVERAGQQEFDSKAAATKPDAEVRGCRDREQIGSEGLAIIKRGLEGGNLTGADVMKIMEKNQKDLESFLVKRCGVPASKYDLSQKIREYVAAHAAGAKAAGVTEQCYDKLKEFATAFCKGLTPAQQKAATEQGIKVPGTSTSGSDVFWVFTADEAKAFFPRCGELMQGLKATGYGEK
jgi:hypothetical protein